MTLDTNIVIAYIAGDENVIHALDVWKEAGSPLFLPAVAESEVLAFSGWDEAERIRVKMFLVENLVFIPFDRNMTSIAADIRRETKVKFPDAAIAATALFTKTTLVTRNTKDFRRVPGLSVQEV